MVITLRYSVVLPEGCVIPNLEEPFKCDGSEEGKKPARDRYRELKKASFVANLKFEIKDDPAEEHIVTVAFKTYDYKVKGPVKRNQYVTVLSGGEPVKLKVLDVDPPVRKDINYVYVEEVC